MSTVDWVRTRNQICEMALRKVGAFADNEILSGKKLDNAVQNLNMITKRLQFKNVFLWNLVQHAVISTVAGTQTYTVTDDNIVGIHQAWIRTGTGVNASDDQLTVSDYQQLLNTELKVVQGQPTNICLNYDFIAPRIYLWPVPDAVYNLYVVCIQKMKDWDNASDSTLFPPWWVEPLVWMLASALAPDYGKNSQDQALLEARAKESFEQARLDNFVRATDIAFEPY